MRWKLSFVNFSMLLASIPDYKSNEKGDSEKLNYIAPKDEAAKLRKYIK